MIAVANRFRVAEGHEEAFLDRFRDGRGGVAGRDGFVRFEVLRPAREDTDTHVVVTYWESMADFEAWTDSEAFREAHADRPPAEMFAGENQLEIHEVAVERTPGD